MVSALQFCREFEHVKHMGHLLGELFRVPKANLDRITRGNRIRELSAVKDNYAMRLVTCIVTVRQRIQA
ncbi:hypothetical protein AQJ43_03990 [Streptomyces avermitilis]|nr:hypothetical protein AQJ43_03990 [Streptomyces avermitilis]OOV32522.1 hypothetical protein SM007_06780 [Streptomyces avermitilis]